MGLSRDHKFEVGPVLGRSMVLAINPLFYVHLRLSTDLRKSSSILRWALPKS